MANIFAEKNVSSCRSYSHFFSKNTCDLDIVLTRTVNILTSNKLVKLTMLVKLKMIYRNMCLFQQQYAYLAVQALMAHLDKHVRSDPKIKSAILAVLFESVLIAAGGSIGKSWSSTTVCQNLSLASSSQPSQVP